MEWQKIAALVILVIVTIGMFRYLEQYGVPTLGALGISMVVGSSFAKGALDLLHKL